MKTNKTISEFKEFIAKGNVMVMAVGVIIGGAFGKIVTSLVNDILMPIVGILIGGIDFTGLKIQVGTATITYGNFIQNVVDFLIVAARIFTMLKFWLILKRQQMINLIKKNLNKMILLSYWKKFVIC